MGKLTLANDIGYNFHLSDNVRLTPYLGFELNTIIYKEMVSEEIWPIYETYPVKNYKNNWSKFYLNYLIGARLNIKNLVIVEAGFNRSLTPIMKLDNLVVKDWIWFFKLGIPVSELIRNP